MTEPSAPLWPLLSAGWSALSRYTGTLLALFLAQLVLAAGAMFAMANVLAAAFARTPLFDRAVDSDVAAWVYLLRNHREVFSAVGWLGAGAVILWQAVSWFLAAGTLGVLGERPEGRADTARCFGSAGAAGFLPFVGLSVLALPTYVLVGLVLGLGLDAVSARVEYALSPEQLFGWLAVGTSPALLLLLLCWTALDYARAELILRRESHGLSVPAAYGRALMFVVTSPRTLVHAGLSYMAILGVAAAYMVASHGHPMAGTRGALALFVVRQGVVLAQLAIRFGTLGGQMALTRQRPAPPAPAAERRRPTGAER